MSDHVEVTKSVSGQWWQMKFRGKVEYTDEEPTERQKVLFRQSVERAPKDARPSGRFHVAVKEAPQ